MSEQNRRIQQLMSKVLDEISTAQKQDINHAKKMADNIVIAAITARYSLSSNYTEVRTAICRAELEALDALESTAKETKTTVH